MTEPCGCANREGHATPHTDPVLHITHGERGPLNDDPPPHESADGTAYCLCGHPDYLTCDRWPDGGIVGLTVHNVGGRYLTTLPSEGGDAT